MANVNPTILEVKIGRAFSAFRRRGLIALSPGYFRRQARGNLYFALEEVKDLLENAPTKRGYVFYLDQGQPCQGPVSIYCGAQLQSESWEYGAVGHLVAKALRKQGLVVVWDGNPGRTLQVGETSWEE